MTRRTFRHRDVSAGCFVCHGGNAHWTSANAQGLAAQHHDRTGHQTWCRIETSVTYGAEAGDDRQIDIEDAIASASSGGQAGSRPPCRSRRTGGCRRRCERTPRPPGRDA